MNDLHLFMKAVDYATKAHEGQTRNDGSPYINHPISVATMLATEYDWYDVDTLCVAVLHDVIEDCSIDNNPNFRYDQIKELFGAVVARGVAALSKNMSRNGSDGKLDVAAYYDHISHSLPFVRAVKVADRIHNISDMTGWKEKRIRKYVDETKQYVLPLGLITDVLMYEKLKSIVEQKESDLSV